MKYFAVAYYKFTDIEDPQREVKNHKRFFENRDVAGRIYISEEGINGQMSGSEADAESYMNWLKSDPRFADTLFKIHVQEENLFARMTVKYRKQLVALDQKLDTRQGGEHVSPEEWKKMLESDEDYLVIDVRNDYESKIGHFEGAELPPLKTFRDFPQYTDSLKKKVDPSKTKVMMYCTGGIRCELYSAMMKEKGFNSVYQLDGGVINYGLKEGKKHWKGKLFVFDDRMAIPISNEEAEPIAHCSHCDTAEDTYYNCANMDCNNLFLSCKQCIEEKKGCCSSECMGAERVRPFDASRGNKPFRRKHECACALPAQESAAV